MAVPEEPLAHPPWVFVEASRSSPTIFYCPSNLCAPRRLAQPSLLLDESFQSSTLALFVSLFAPTQLVKKPSGLVPETEPISDRPCNFGFFYSTECFSSYANQTPCKQVNPVVAEL